MNRFKFTFNESLTSLLIHFITFLNDCIMFHQEDHTLSSVGNLFFSSFASVSQNINFSSTFFVFNYMFVINKRSINSFKYIVILNNIYTFLIETFFQSLTC
jgi:hypothetical protein